MFSSWNNAEKVGRNCWQDLKANVNILNQWDRDQLALPCTQRIKKLYFVAVLLVKPETRKLNPQENTELCPARFISKPQLFTKKY